MKRGSRRRFITVAGGLAVAAVLPATATAQMNRMPPNNMPEVIRRLVGTAKVNTGRVKLGVPPLVENGHLVPLTVTVESPMTEADHVKAVHIVNERNPQPQVISVTLGPRAGRATLSTRIKLADSQQVVAVAEMSDGSFWSESADVIVTLAACVEDLVR